MAEESAEAKARAEARQRALDRLGEVWTESKACPICGGDDWSIGDFVDIPLRQHCEARSRAVWWRRLPRHKERARGLCNGDQARSGHPVSRVRERPTCPARHYALAPTTEGPDLPRTRVLPDRPRPNAMAFVGLTPVVFRTGFS
jgi:hypothetical protein